jgi:acyl-CoA synthetase (AMP-forming)/AMP-acid ligase II
MSEPLNIAQRLRDHAHRAPGQAVLIRPRGEDGAPAVVKTYLELDRESDAIASGFEALGIGLGTKTILMVRPGFELVSIVFALFKLGAVPVIVDPGMGIARMLHCYRSAGAEAFIGIPVAHLIRLARPRAFASVKACVTVGNRRGWGGLSLDELMRPSKEPRPLAPTRAEDLLVINFTTGSTGPAKGVEYTHAMAGAMAGVIASLFAATAGHVSLATLPLFALFDVLLGGTSVLAPMDPTRPAEADAALLFDAISDHRVTTMFASPALLDTLARYGASSSRALPTLRTVLSGGAPVSIDVVASFSKLLAAEARLFTTYGATEALPIASIEAREVLAATQEGTREGRGSCVGRPPSGLEIRILTRTEDALASNDASELPRGEVGEIAIAGPNVSASYHRAPEANAHAKVRDGDRLWHRTGDLGLVDEHGRLWIAGRKTQVVRTPTRTLFSVQCEGVLDAHPEVARSALVGVGPSTDQKPVACIELRAPTNREGERRIAAELRALAETNGVPVTTFLFHPGFPVDIRHNAKIAREELAVWATVRLGGRPPSSGDEWLAVVPILGWLYVILGLAVTLEPAPLRWLWWIDLVLSVGLHALQLFVSVPLARRLGYGTGVAVLSTMLLGATWWKPLARLVSPSTLVRRRARA